MLTLDSNILSAIFRGEETAQASIELLEQYRGDVVLYVAAFAEVLAGPGIARANIENFLADADITLDWTTNAATWERAITAFTEYATRRRNSGGGQPRRILADP